MVYVAYLDGDLRLVDVYAINLVSGGDLGAVLARDAEAHPGCQQVVGPAAELVFYAVTGRDAGCHPDGADAGFALTARRVLESGVDLPGFAECWRAVAQWGDFIQPWYGVLRLDEDGVPVLDDVVYGRKIEVAS